ncbi:class I adenylate-forming enzyme family protein [Stutzerimonas stutzeri]|uniref:class I adenylate-forming enzyme family protein n=1 Tax=Stutzerimonas stutzeri TaxID=316 RepID=UPI00244C27E6|nr:class I adenylate-forming enzyme family protein [Stutzerimonas stutzeri]MDH0426651.1 acyl--CoA ligase [Stutzerimonas stutzeri]
MATGLGERIRAVLALEPDKGAFEFKSEWHSWGDVAAEMAQIEALLDAAGLGEGAAVGILLRNRPAHVAAVLQILASKRCVVALNPFQTAAKVADDLRKLQLPALIADVDDWQVAEIRAAVEEVGSQGIAISSKERLHAQAVAGFEYPRSGQAFAEPLPEVGVLMLTSGTTGPAKRIQLPYRNFERALFDAVHYESRNDGGELKLKESALLLCTPLVHIGGLFFAVLAVVGARPLAILEKFNVDEFTRSVVAYKPRTVSLPPTAVRMILDAKVPPENLSSLLAIRTGSAPLDPAMAEEFEATYGFPLLDTYGATEFAGAVAGWTIRDHKAFGKSKRGSAGRAQPGCQLRVVDAQSGEELPPSTVGLLEVKAAQVDPNKWLRTTDLAEIDADGFLFIRGRSDDAIIRGGFKVLPREVEKVLREHPAVQEASVVGLPDARLGAVPVAAVQLEDGASATAEELIAFAREKLTSYQVPVSLRIVTALPRTPSMKVSQPEVRALFA